MPGPPERTSEILLRLAKDTADERIAVADLAERLGDRGFGVLLCLWALPCAIPIPGLSTPFGLLIMLTGFQMILGFARPWLPGFILNQSVGRADFNHIIAKALPHIERLERYCLPRWRFAAGGIAERLLGVIMVGLGLILTLPILGGNLLPAIAIVIMALGIIEYDGLAVLIGFIVSVISVILVGAIIGTALAVFVGFFRAIGINL
ncbi:MAG: exopolysaccharide biosynthesis protein [Alphaproteobacteria bacterium]